MSVYYPYHYPQWASSANSSAIACYSSYSLDHAKTEEDKLSPILLIGGVHGDEPEGVELAEKALQWLTSQDQKDIPHHWILIPCINPDGFAKNERTNGHNVDLNRNYPAKSWSAQHEKKRYFPGLSPQSEPEIKALVSLISKQKPKLIIHCHSWNPCVVYTGQRGKNISEKISHLTGYPAQETIGYDTPGSLGDYAGIDLDIPTICIEAQEGVPLKSIWPKFESSIKWLFNTTHELQV